MFIVKLFYAVLLIGSGAAIIKYRRTVKSWTGNFVWAERYIGSGGTYFIIMLAGILMMFFGVIYPFGGTELLIGEPKQVDIGLGN